MTGKVPAGAGARRKPPQPKGGSRKGIPNKATREFRDTVRALLERNSDNVGRWLAMVAEGDGEGAKPDPARALDLLTKLAEFAAPKLGRIEHAGDPANPLRTEAVVNITIGGSGA